MLAEQEACYKFQEMGECALGRERRGQRLVIKAQVKKDNLASNHIFTKLGYEKCGEEYKKTGLIR